MEKIKFEKVIVRPSSMAGHVQVIEMNIRKAGKILERNLLGARISNGRNSSYILKLMQ